jgi:hypothetical protein
LFYINESLTDLLAYPLPVLCKEMHHTGSLCGPILDNILLTFAVTNGTPKVLL